MMMQECKSQTWMLFHTKLQFGFVQNDLFDMQMPYEYQHVAVISVMWEVYSIGNTMGGRHMPPPPPDFWRWGHRGVLDHSTAICILPAYHIYTVEVIQELVS